MYTYMWALRNVCEMKEDDDNDNDDERRKKLMWSIIWWFFSIDKWLMRQKMAIDSTGMFSFPFDSVKIQ